MSILIAGNWKMNMTPAESAVLAREILSGMASIEKCCDVLVCPSHVALTSVRSVVDGSALQLGAQNMYCEPKGAFTGEISPGMLLASGCSHVILGHSERRHVLNESDEFINKKMKLALQSNLVPIICVGETISERNDGLTVDIIKRQLELGLKDCRPERADDLAVAYEPVWAIGTGKTASPDQAQQVHVYIREQLRSYYGKTAMSIRILYGGSVNADTIDSLLMQPDIDGALVGGASLKAVPFLALIRAGTKANNT
ncbi:triose-phosphate isomerase [bacterium]|nr:triose-phosphate isomerase [candidate division CSSED10-310 bacterium]